MTSTQDQMGTQRHDQIFAVDPISRGGGDTPQATTRSLHIPRSQRAHHPQSPQPAQSSTFASLAGDPLRYRSKRRRSHSSPPTETRRSKPESSLYVTTLFVYQTRQKERPAMHATRAKPAVLQSANSGCCLNAAEPIPALLSDSKLVLGQQWVGDD